MLSHIQLSKFGVNFLKIPEHICKMCKEERLPIVIFQIWIIFLTKHKKKVYGKELTLG